MKKLQNIGNIRYLGQGFNSFPLDFHLVAGQIEETLTLIPGLSLADDSIYLSFFDHFTDQEYLENGPCSVELEVHGLANLDGLNTHLQLRDCNEAQVIRIPINQDLVNFSQLFTYYKTALNSTLEHYKSLGELNLSPGWQLRISPKTRPITQEIQFFVFDFKGHLT